MKKPANFRLRAFEFLGSPTWTRTRELRINRQQGKSLENPHDSMFFVALLSNIRHFKSIFRIGSFIGGANPF